MHLDLNADVGEATDPEGIDREKAILRAVTSANVACGFHAGTPSGIRRTVRTALERGVKVGAHPSFLDREGFGRTDVSLPADEIEDLVVYQVAALAGLVAAAGGRLSHVKPHGAMYNIAARDRGAGDAVARAVRRFDDRLIVFAPPASALADAATSAGLTVFREGFADRAYRQDGSLVPRGTSGALVLEPVVVVDRVLRMVRESTVVAIDGSVVSLEVDTVCLHGDTPGAAHLARQIRAALQEAGVTVRAALPRALDSDGWNRAGQGL